MKNLNNLFAGPTPEQLEAIRKQEAIEAAYSKAVYAYSANYGHDMPLDEAQQLYETMIQDSKST